MLACDAPERWPGICDHGFVIVIHISRRQEDDAFVAVWLVSAVEYGGCALVLRESVLGVRSGVLGAGALCGDDVGPHVGTDVAGHHGPGSAHQVWQPSRQDACRFELSRRSFVCTGIVVGLLVATRNCICREREKEL